MSLLIGLFYLTLTFISNYLTSPSFLDDNFKVRENDILFARTGASVGKTYHYDRNDGNLYYAGFLISAHIINEINSKFIFFITLTKNYKKWVRIMSARSGQPGINADEYSNYKFYIPIKKEQDKITEFLNKVDERIQTQIKIIDDYSLLKDSIIHQTFSIKYPKIKLSFLLKEVNERNKSRQINTVLSVSNKLGFIKQSEQFEDREIASNDTSNYKIVNYGDYAYNPARINVGSIARLKNYDKGIISPMYSCFKINEEKIINTYFDMFLDSNSFKKQLNNKLEGSVRQCLTFDGMLSMNIQLPSIEIQKSISRKFDMLNEKIQLETDYLNALIKQKQFLLNNMFI